MAKFLPYLFGGKVSLVEPVLNISFIHSYLEDFIISVIPCFALKFYYKLNPTSFLGSQNVTLIKDYHFMKILIEFGNYEGVQTEEYCGINSFHI